MRTKNVTVNGKQVTVKEAKIKEFKDVILPKVFGMLDGVELKDKQVVDLIPLFSEKVAEFFPELSEADIEESYPSEIEGLIEAYIEVNFSGLKKMAKPLFGLLRSGIQTQQ
jgi:hypothetical protein